MEEPEGLGLADYLGILRRRIWYLIIPAILIFVVAAAVAAWMPATYRSTATILIEQQQIPQDLVRSTVTSYADQRVQTISQRVMTTANLSKIIEKYNLFADERKSQSMQTVVNRMRSNVKLEMVDAKVVDPRSGSAKQATIAFTLSFDSASPKQAQQVANEMVSLFLDENLRKRQEAARETSAFLQGEAERLAGQIADLEAKVARVQGGERREPARHAAGQCPVPDPHRGPDRTQRTRGPAARRAHRAAGGRTRAHPALRRQRPREQRRAVGRGTG